jgi:4-hydroxy-4-methyl-2-oxoglutarate aldolase
VILADDDGALCVPRDDVPSALERAHARVDKEEATRQAFRDGQLGLDRYGLREKLAALGVRYVTAAEYGAR